MQILSLESGRGTKRKFDVQPSGNTKNIQALADNAANNNPILGIVSSRYIKSFWIYFENS